MTQTLHRITWLFLCFIALYSAAGAAGHGESKETQGNNQIEMPFIVAPATQDGKLVGFYYISYQMTTASADTAKNVKAKLAVLQDALVRAVYKQNVFKEGHPDELDKDAFRAIILNEAKKLAHVDNSAKITITTFKYSRLHAKIGEDAPAQQADKPDTHEETKDSAHKKPAGH